MVGTTSVVNLDPAMIRAISRDLENDGLLRSQASPPSPNARRQLEA